jgi:hypothetical protein
MDWLVKKLQLLLAILLGAFVMAGCAAGDVQDPPLDAPVTGNQEPRSNLEKNPAAVPSPSDAPVPTATPNLAPLPVIGPAPSWDNDTWINTDNPLLLEDLRGKVVLLEFWTFG